MSDDHYTVQLPDTDRALVGATTRVFQADGNEVPNVGRVTLYIEPDSITGIIETVGEEPEIDDQGEFVMYELTGTVDLLRPGLPYEN